MKAFLRNTLLLACVWLLLSGVCLAREVHLKDGSIIDCESVWRRGDRVVVKINRDTMLEFRQDQVDLGRTFPKAKVKPRQVKKKKAAAVVRHRRAVKPAASSAASPSQSAPKAAAPKLSASPQPAAKPQPPAKPRPAAKPDQSSAPAPAPEPAASEPAKPGQVETSSAEPASTPDQAEQEQNPKQAADMMAQAVRDKDPEMLKQAIEAQQGATPKQSLAGAGASLTVLLLVLALGLLVIVSFWMVFAKAGEAGWKSLIPIYNMYVLLLISGKPGWWLLLLFIPVVGSIFHLLAMLSLAERFGKGALYGVGLFFLPMIFFPLLAFGEARYEG